MSAGVVVDGWRSTYGASTREAAERLAEVECAKWKAAKAGREVRVREGRGEGETTFVVEVRDVG